MFRFFFVFFRWLGFVGGVLFVVVPAASGLGLQLLVARPKGRMKDALFVCLPFARGCSGHLRCVISLACISHVLPCVTCRGGGQQKMNRAGSVYGDCRCVHGGR